MINARTLSEVGIGRQRFETKSGHEESFTIQSPCFLDPLFGKMHGFRLGIGKPNAKDQAPEWRVDHK